MRRAEASSSHFSLITESSKTFKRMGKKNCFPHLLNICFYSDRAEAWMLASHFPRQAAQSAGDLVFWGAFILGIPEPEKPSKQEQSEPGCFFSGKLKCLIKSLPSLFQPFSPPPLGKLWPLLLKHGQTFVLYRVVVLVLLLSEINLFHLWISIYPLVKMGSVIAAKALWDLWMKREVVSTCIILTPITSHDSLNRQNSMQCVQVYVAMQTSA